MTTPTEPGLRILTKEQFENGMLARLADGTEVTRYYTPICEQDGAIVVVDAEVDEVTDVISNASEVFIPLPDTPTE